WWNRPVDSPLSHLLTDARQARTTMLDGLHVRIVDLPAALEGRRFASDVDIVIEVDDPLCDWNSGRWHVAGDADNSRCTRTDADPHSLTIADADVVIEDGRVVDVGPGLDGDDVVDLSGRTLPPGMFDCHTHVVMEHFDYLRVLTEPFSLQFFYAVKALRQTLD